MFWNLNSDGSIRQSIGLPTFLSGWRFAGTGDFFSSGRPHIILQNTTTGERVIWRMNDTSISSSAGLPTLPLTWTIRNKARTTMFAPWQSLNETTLVLCGTLVS